MKALEDARMQPRYVIEIPAGATYVLAFDILKLIADKIKPIPDVPLRLSDLGKRTLQQDRGTLSQTLSDSDHDLLDVIFVGLPKLSRNITKAEWPAYQEAFDNAPNRPEWDLTTSFTDPNKEFHESAWKEARCEYYKTMQTALEKERIRVWTKSGTPESTIKWDSQILVNDARAYLASIMIELQEIGSNALETTAERKPLTRTAAQDAAILNHLKTFNYDPLKLPKQEIGKRWVKSEVSKVALKDTAIFVSERVFNTAWQRLRDRGELRVSDTAG